MGQRHQVYYRLPREFFFEGNCNNRPERNIGFHVQWSYGTLPVRNVLRVFDWLRKAGRDAHMGTAKWSMPYSLNGDLIYVQSFDAVAGNVSRYYPLGKVDSAYGDDQERGNAEDQSICDDPRNGDNNDGITVIDLCPVAKGKPPTYAFVSIDGLDAAGIRDCAKAGVPLSAAQYMAAYYPAGSDNMPKDIGQLIDAMAQYKVMSAARLRTIFPAWLGKQKAK